MKRSAAILNHDSSRRGDDKPKPKGEGDKPAAKKDDPAPKEDDAPADDVAEAVKPGEAHMNAMKDVAKRQEGESRDMRGSHRDEIRKMQERHIAEMAALHAKGGDEVIDGEKITPTVRDDGTMGTEKPKGE